MEAIEPRIVWVSKLGYEVIEEKLVGCVEFLLNRPKDPMKPRYGLMKKSTWKFK